MISASRADKAKELQTLWDAWNAHNVKALWTSAGESEGGE